MNRVRSFLLAACLAAPALGAAQPAGTSLAITGVVRTPLTIDARQLATYPRQTVEITSQERTVRYEGVLVGTLLERAGATVGADLRGAALATYVVATGADGYRVVFAIAELDPAMSAADVLVADTADGKPLTEAQGPFRLVTPKDRRGARGVRQLQRLDVVRLP